MFDIGFSELLIIGVVALLVLGPERLPKAARFVGLWVRRARAQWYSVKSEFERELAAEDIRRIADPVRELRDAAEGARRDLDAAGRELGEASRELGEAAREAGEAVRESAEPAPPALPGDGNPPTRGPGEDKAAG